MFKRFIIKLLPKKKDADYLIYGVKKIDLEIDADPEYRYFIARFLFGKQWISDNGDEIVNVTKQKLLK